MAPILLNCTFLRQNASLDLSAKINCQIYGPSSLYSKYSQIINSHKTSLLYIPLRSLINVGHPHSKYCAPDLKSSSASLQSSGSGKAKYPAGDLHRSHFAASHNVTSHKYCIGEQDLWKFLWGFVFSKRIISVGFGVGACSLCSCVLCNVQMLSC